MALKRLVVPTDGTEEAMSVDGRQFGRERIFDLVRNNRDKPAVDIVEALFQAARDFSEQRPQEDDITALIVKVLPTASAKPSDQPEGCG
jgi:sigma-B regulation protein RsbU (phosphoserine phosphatase)